MEDKLRSIIFDIILLTSKSDEMSDISVDLVLKKIDETRKCLLNAPKEQIDKLLPTLSELLSLLDHLLKTVEQKQRGLLLEIANFHKDLSSIQIYQKEYT